MHIVYCIPSLHLAAGMERILTAKATYLVKEYGYKVSFVTYCMKGRKAAFELDSTICIYDLDIDYESANAFNPIKKLWIKKKLRNLHKTRMSQLLKRLNPDIVVSTFMDEVSFLPNIHDGSKKVLEFHFCKGYKNKVAKMNNYPWWAVLSNYWNSWADVHVRMPRFDRFVCLTQEDVDSWGGDSSKKLCIYNMLPWKAEQKASLENKTVIAIGRLEPQKGFDKLISIWSIIADKHPDWKLNIFGDGPDKWKLSEQITSLGLNNSIFLKGSSKKMSEEYLSSSIMVMTSRFEGLPMCMLEAKMYGLPVVSYDFPCGPKDLIHHGIDGFLVNNDDEKMFCHYVDSLMKDSNLRIDMGKAQLEDTERFSPDIIMPQWKKMFEELMALSNERSKK